MVSPGWCVSIVPALAQQHNAATQLLDKSNLFLFLPNLLAPSLLLLEMLLTPAVYPLATLPTTMCRLN